MKLPLSIDDAQAIQDAANPHTIPSLVEAIDRLQTYMNQIRLLSQVALDDNRNLPLVTRNLLEIRGLIDQIMPEG